MAQQSTELTLLLDGGKRQHIREREDWQEAAAWLSDPTRPGRYSYNLEYVHPAFIVSDPNVALEFKVRWC